MEFNIKFDLSSQELLDKYGEEYIYNFYRTKGEDFNFNKFNTCEFHEDKTPSLKFYKKGNSLLFKCFGCGISGNVFSFVKEKLDLYEFKDIINSLNTDLENKHYIKQSTFIPTLPSRVDIITTKRKWEYYDYCYWNQFNISIKDCIKFDIEPVYEVFINKESEVKLVFINIKNNPIYSINIGDNKKIYRPLASKGSKWLQNCNRNDVMGYNSLPKKGKLLFITSSMKDVIVFTNLGYNAIAPVSETTLVPENIMIDLLRRFKRIIVFLDHDDAGLLFSNVYKEIYNLETMTTNSEAKDISDYIKEYGIQLTTKLINDLIL